MKLVLEVVGEEFESIERNMCEAMLRLLRGFHDGRGTNEDGRWRFMTDRCDEWNDSICDGLPDEIM